MRATMEKTTNMSLVDVFFEMDFKYPLVIWNTRCGEIRDQMTKGYSCTVCYIDIINLLGIRFCRGKNLVASDKLPR